MTSIAQQMGTISSFGSLSSYLEAAEEGKNGRFRRQRLCFGVAHFLCGALPHPHKERFHLKEPRPGLWGGHT